MILCHCWNEGGRSRPNGLDVDIAPARGGRRGIARGRYGDFDSSVCQRSDGGSSFVGTFRLSVLRALFGFALDDLARVTFPGGSERGRRPPGRMGGPGTVETRMSSRGAGSAGGWRRRGQKLQNAGYCSGGEQRACQHATAIPVADASPQHPKIRCSDAVQR